MRVLQLETVTVAVTAIGIVIVSFRQLHQVIRVLQLETVTLAVTSIGIVIVSFRQLH